MCRYLAVPAQGPLIAALFSPIIWSYVGQMIHMLTLLTHVTQGKFAKSTPVTSSQALN